MPDLIIELTDSNFEQAVLASVKPVWVEMWAPWCAPCQAMASIVEQLALEINDIIDVGRLNVDENYITAR